jgi:hypothetical protein
VAIFYLDPENGDDANDGTTFVNRWRTIGLGATAARIAPGDIIRIIASRDPYNAGAAQWTNNTGSIVSPTAASRYVTWATPGPVKVIDAGETAWTAATNITATTVTTTYKIGTRSLQFTPATAFTTGKAAHRAFPSTLDLSEYQGVSFWFRSGTTAIPDGRYEIHLCSDSTGDTPVHVIPVKIGEASAWCTVEWHNGAALSSNINSIALVALTDPGTTVFGLDNIVAIKGRSDSRYISHACAIGKNTVGEPDWYGILGFDDDAVYLGGCRDVNPGSSLTVRPPSYVGTTESVDTWVLQAFDADAALATAARTVADFGTIDDPIIFSGGWNRTDMSTQTGASYYHGRHYFSGAITCTRANISFEKIGGLYFLVAVVHHTSATTGNFTCDLEHAIGCREGMLTLHNETFIGFAKLKFKSIYGAYMGLLNFTSATTVPMTAGKVFIYGGRIHGSVGGTAFPALTLSPNMYAYIDRVDNNDTSLQFAPTPGTRGEVTIHGATFDIKGVLAATNVVGTLPNCRVNLIGCSILGDNTLQTETSTTSSIRLVRHNGNPLNHQLIHHDFAVFSDTAIRHTASGLAWRLEVYDRGADRRPNSNSPARFPLAKVACVGGSAVEVKCWVRRSDASLSAGLQVMPSDIVGTPSTLDPIRVLTSASAGDWSELTLTFTPSETGAVEVEGIAWGAVESAHFDDITVT